SPAVPRALLRSYCHGRANAAWTDARGRLPPHHPKLTGERLAVTCVTGVSVTEECLASRALPQPKERAPEPASSTRPLLRQRSKVGRCRPDIRGHAFGLGRAQAATGIAKSDRPNRATIPGRRGQATPMSSIVKRSIRVDGRKTRISLEPEFWDGLKEIAVGRGVSVSKLVTSISSAVRLFVLGHY